MLTDDLFTNEQRRFLNTQRVARLATADRSGLPHVVPVCFALNCNTLYIAIDGKPKRGSAAGLKRLRNIEENPAVSLVIDRYDEDWSRLGWIQLHGRGETHITGDEIEAAHALLRALSSIPDDGS